MATYYLYPDGTSSTGSSWGPTGAATIHAAIDDLTGANDGDTTYAQGSATTWDYFICTLAPMVDVVEITSITAHCWYNNAGGGANQEVDFGIRIGSTNYLNGSIAVVSSTYAEATKTWTLNPATSAPWTKPQLDDLSVIAGTQDAGGKPIDSVRVTSLFISVEYQPIPAGIGAAREIASHRLRRYRRPLVEPSLEVGLDKLDLELMDDLSLSHFAYPESSGLGAGIANWKRALMQLRETDVDLNNMTVRLGMRGRRGFLCSFWDGAESRRSSSAAEDGVARLGSGGTVAYARNSHAWIEDPGSGLVVQIGLNQKPVALDGLLMENFATNYLAHSSASEGATSVAGLTLAGTGVNSSAIAAESSPTEPLFDSTVSNYCYKFTAGNPHAADLRATWPATVSHSANTKLRLSVDHKDDSGATLSWRLTRGIDGFFWNDTTGLWGVGAVNNAFTVQTTRARDRSKVIDVGAGATTVTLALQQTTGGTASRVNRAYHVQLEQNAWATSRVVTTASTYAREVQTYSVTQTADPRALHNDGFTFMCEFTPEWNAADMVAINGFPSLFQIAYDANNSYNFYWNNGTGSWDLDCEQGGVITTASFTTNPSRGTTYKLCSRMTTSAGEHGLVSTHSVFVNGIKGTDATRAADPTQSATTALYIGGDSIGNACNGNIRRILFTQEPYSDVEIERFAP